MPIEPDEKESLIAEAVKRAMREAAARRRCPACKAEDAFRRGRCENCGAYYDSDGKLRLPEVKRADEEDLW